MSAGGSTYDYQYSYSLTSTESATYNFVGVTVVREDTGYMYASVLVGAGRDVGMVYTNIRWNGGTAPF